MLELSAEQTNAKCWLYHPQSMRCHISLEIFGRAKRVRICRFKQMSLTLQMNYCRLIAIKKLIVNHPDTLDMPVADDISQNILG